MDFWNGGYSCYAIGGYPVTVNDAAENEMVRLLAGEQNAWIGLHDGREEGRFEWMVGSSNYTNWSEGEPNNYNDREDCVEITPDGLWNDNYCGARRRVVCELPLE